jgi:hypothetical protein
MKPVMSAHERELGESERYRRYQSINKTLMWGLVGPHSCSLFSAHLDGPPDEWCSPSYAMYIDWPTAQAWRRALIDATGITPSDPHG